MPDLICTGCDEALRDDAPEGPYKRFESVGCGLDQESYAEHRHEHIKNLKARADALRCQADALDARAKAVAAGEAVDEPERRADE